MKMQNGEEKKQVIMRERTKKNDTMLIMLTDPINK